MSYLTLGDGDFSYSLDLCRYFASADAYSKVNDANASSSRPTRRHVTCTGIDSSCELTKKYRDSGSILKKISSLEEKKVRKKADRKRKRCNKKGLKDCAASSALPLSLAHLSIQIQHEINAIVMPNSISSSSNETKSHDNVIFNHPHIGTESAALHRRFLSHLFDSVDRIWLSRNGLFHLTLVLGQAERWDCLEAASKRGFQLLHRGEFRPPPSPFSFLSSDEIVDDDGLGKETYYRSRRHQSGRSFATRSAGSETLTFGRLSDRGQYIGKCLPWQMLPASCWDSQNAAEASKLTLACPFCTKQFKDERARKNHIKCSHPDSATTSATLSNQGHTSEAEELTIPKQYVCDQCPADEKNGSGRIFATAQGLEDHIKAKHSGLHSNIKPDWAQTSANAGSQAEKVTTKSSCENKVEDAPSTSTPIGSCSICGIPYHSEVEKLNHLVEFVPKPAVSTNGDADIQKFCCSYCDKAFKDSRACKQHENFCSKNDSIKI